MSFGAPLSSPSPSFASFGASAPAAGTTFGGFGGTSSLSGFGASNTAQPTSGFGTTPTAGFGSTLGQSSSAFGSPQPPSAFAAPSNSFGGFGSSSSGTSAPAASTGFGGFGSSSSATTSAPFGSSGIGGSFGTSSNPAAGTNASAFGSGPLSSFSGFGGGSTSAFGATTQSPSFGGATTQTPSFGGFGTNTAGSGSSPFGGFKSIGTTGGLGTSSASSSNAFAGFGSLSSPIAGASSAFGRPSTSFGGASNTTGAFGTIAPSNSFTGFGQTSSAPAGFNPASQSDWPGSLRVRELQQLYAPSIDAASGSYLHSDAASNAVPNKSCEFQTVVYSLIGGSTGMMGIVPGRKPEGVSMLKWEQMESDNPDPELLAPVVERGIHALKRRVECQGVDTRLLTSYVSDAVEAYRAIESAVQRAGLRYADLHARQGVLLSRLLGVMTKIEVLRCRDVALSVDEGKLHARLKKMIADMQAPHTKLIALRNMQAQLKKHRVSNASASELLQSADVLHLKQTLKRQSETIDMLCTMIEKDERSVAILRKGTSPRIADF